MWVISLKLSTRNGIQKNQWNYHKGFVLVYVFISIENDSSNTTLLICYNFPQITGAYNNTDFPYQETATDALPW